MKGLCGQHRTAMQHGPEDARVDPFQFIPLRSRKTIYFALHLANTRESRS